MIHYAYTILYVPDVKTSMRFYQQAFELEEKLMAPPDYGELSTGSTILAFAAFELSDNNLPKGYLRSSPDRSPFGVEIGFTTDDVAATVQTVLRAGGQLYQALTTKPWGQEVAYVRDPDGFLIEICTPVNYQ